MFSDINKYINLIDNEKVINTLGTITLEFILIITVVWFILTKLESIKKIITNSLLNRSVESNVKHQAKSISIIKYGLNEICRVHNADRSYIMLLHNGIHSKNNIDVLKFSITDEGLSGKYKSIMESIQDIPASLYGSWIDSLYDNSVVDIKNIKDIMKTKDGLYNLFEKNNVKSVYMFPIFPISSNIPDGFGVLEFCDERKELSQKEIAQISQEFAKIYTIKEISAKKDKE